MHIAHVIMYCISMLKKQQRHQVPRKALIYQLARQCEIAISVKLFFFKWGNNFLVFLPFYLDSESKWHLCSLGSACFVRQMISTLWQLITLYQLKINLKRNHHESHWEWNDKRKERKKGNVRVYMRLISENLVTLRQGTQLNSVMPCLSCEGNQLITESHQVFSATQSPCLSDAGQHSRLLLCT